MHVVIVDADVSYPPTSGKRLRTLNLMLPLARRHRITYLARGHHGPEEARRAREFLGDHGIETLVVDHPTPRKRGLGFYARLAANLLSPLPYSAATHTSAPMCKALQEYAAQHRVDVWQFELAPYLHAFKGPPGTRRVLNAHNVDTLIWQRYYETEANPLRRWYVRGQWRKFERFERAVFREATRVVACSEDDAELVRSHFGCDRVDVVENGIDGAYFQDVVAGHDPGRILFLGSLEWRPNLDAVRLLLDQVFPAVRTQVPEARLEIVGRHPPPWLVQRAAAEPQVELFADVPDVRPHLARCALMSVPLRIGGGSRLKILEALACGLPVVSTRVGAEGLNLEAGRELAVVADVEEMASALVVWLRDPERARITAERGRRTVLERYDWGPLADKLERTWERCLTSESPRVLVKR